MRVKIRVSEAVKAFKNMCEHVFANYCTVREGKKSVRREIAPV